MARRFQESVLPAQEEVPIDRRPRILSLPVLGLALVGLIASDLLDAFPPFPRFVVVFCVLSYLPGEALLRRLVGPRWRAPELRVPLAVLTGLSVSSVVSWLCRILGVPFGTYLIVLEAAAAVVISVPLWSARRRAARAGARAGGLFDRPGDARTAALLAVAFVVCAYFLVSPPAIDPRGDTLDHIGYIRNIVLENRLEPEDVLAPAVFAGEAPTTGDPRKGAMHPLLAAMSELSSMEPIQLWRWLPVVLAPLAVLCFGAFASVLLPSGVMVAVALVLFLMFQGGIGRQFLGVIAYGQHLSLAFFWLLFVTTVACASAPSAGPLIAVGLLCLGGSLIHVDVAVHTGLMYAGMLLFYKKLEISGRAIIRIGGVLAACAAVGVAWKLWSTAATPNVMHTHAQGLLYFGDLGSRFFTVSPVEVIRRNGLVFAVGLCLIPLLLLAGRDRRFVRAAWMNFALALPPLLVAFNPFLAPPVYDRVTYLLHRFVLNVPSLAITSLVLGSVVVWGRNGTAWKKAVAVLVLVAWARPFTVSAEAWWREARSARPAPGHAGCAREMRADLSDVIRLFNEKLPRGCVVLSDPLTSYVLSAFCDARVVAVLHQHGNPNDPYPLERLDAVHAVMSPYSSQRRMLYAIRKFGVEYVVVNGTFRSAYHDYLADWDPAFKTVLDEKIGGFKEVFRTVYDQGDITVYRVLGTEFTRMTWDPGIPFTRPTGGDLEACEGTGEGTVRVVSLGVDPEVALPGERGTITAVYRRGAGAPPRLPLSLRLRFEDTAYFERSPSYPGDKIVRRFLERWRGETRRFRVDHAPFEGFFRPEEWPEDHACYDPFSVRLPLALAATKYEVQFELVEETLLPNFTLRDFIYNDDSYHGSPCTAVDVRRHVVR